MISDIALKQNQNLSWNTPLLLWWNTAQWRVLESSTSNKKIYVMRYQWHDNEKFRFHSCSFSLFCANMKPTNSLKALWFPPLQFSLLKWFNDCMLLQSVQAFLSQYKIMSIAKNGYTVILATSKAMITVMCIQVDTIWWN